MKVVAPCLIVTFAVLGLLAHFALANVRPLQLIVRPRVGVSPQDLFLMVRVPALTDQDRVIRVELTDGPFYRSSEIPLIGSASPPLYSFWWPGIPSGEYVVLARLGDCCEHYRALDRASVVIW